MFTNNGFGTNVIAHFSIQNYAEPLRKFAKHRETALIQQYDAKVLFGNIEQILAVNEAFLEDLTKMRDPKANPKIGGLGDVCLKHVSSRRDYLCSALVNPWPV